MWPSIENIEQWVAGDVGPKTSSKLRSGVSLNSNMVEKMCFCSANQKKRKIRPIGKTLVKIKNGILKYKNIGYLVRTKKGKAAL